MLLVPAALFDTFWYCGDFYFGGGDQGMYSQLPPPPNDGKVLARCINCISVTVSHACQMQHPNTHGYGKGSSMGKGRYPLNMLDYGSCGYVHIGCTYQVA